MSHEPNSKAAVPTRKLAYTFDEARGLLSIGRTVWVSLISSGQIRPIQGHNIVSLAELERFIHANTKPRTGRKKSTEGIDDD